MFGILKKKISSSVKKLAIKVEKEKKIEAKPKKIQKKTKSKEKKSIFNKVTSKITEREFTEKDIDRFFEEEETELLQANIALEVIDFLKDSLKKELGGRSISRIKVKKFVSDSFSKSIKQIVDNGEIDIVKKIKEKKPSMIMFIGFNGSGKCVSGDTLIPLSDGRIIPIKKLYEEQKMKYGEIKIKDGSIIKPKTYPKIFTVEPKGLKVKRASATIFWKLKKDNLIKVTLDNGHEIEVTPEHPFFVLRAGKIEKVRADILRHGEYVMIPKKLDIDCSDNIKKIDILKIISDRNLFVYSPFVAKFYELLKRDYGSLRNAWKNLKIDVSESRFITDWKNKGMLPSDLLIKIYNSYPELRKFLKDVKIKYGKSSSSIKLPEFNGEFYEFIGFFFAEGYLYNRYIEFTNVDNLLLNKFVNLSKNIFNRKCVIKSDSRKGRFHIKKAVIYDRTVSYFLQKVLDLPEKKKSTFMKIPDFMLSVPNKKISRMIRAYWECDGHASKSQRYLESTTASNIFSKQMSTLLLRFGIMTTLTNKVINNKPYYRINISGKEKILKFYREIGVLKDETAVKMRKMIKMPSHFEKTELIPMQGPFLKNLRMSNAMTQSSIAESLNVQNSLISQYEIEDYNVSIPIKKLSKISSIIDSDMFLSSLSNGSVRWCKVKEKKNVKNNDGFVFDITIPGTHNFVANNIVVHNTTTIAKIANYLKSKNIKPVLAAGDTFRAASIEQLKHHGEKLKLKVIKHQYGSDSAAVIFDSRKYAEANKMDVVLADTAGRTHVDTDLMNELKKAVRVNNPELKILVIDSLTGNDAVEQARAFDKAIGIDAIVMTKIDVNEKGGSVLSVSYATKKPILFLGVGQGYKDLKQFDPKKFADELLG